MDHVIPVELRPGTTHILTWLNAALKPKPGMVLLCNGDPRPWTVVDAYHITAGKRGRLRQTGRLALYKPFARSGKQLCPPKQESPTSLLALNESMNSIATRG
jgi:hypothetical protein